jgi:23S rRNA (uracil1939-C5)-methyltransferase
MGRKRKKKVIIEDLEVYELADKGRGVAKDPEGRVVFIERTVPGDIVDVQVSKKKKSMLQAFPIHFKKYSDIRIEPMCKHFEVCGGCTTQNIPYDKQLEFKQNNVIQVLNRIGKIYPEEIVPILPAPSIEFYRNKLEFSFSNKRWLTKEEMLSGISNLEDVLGFHRAGAFDKILNIDKCHLQGGDSNKLRNSIKKLGIEMGFSFYDARTQGGELRNMFVKTSSLNQCMLILSINLKDKERIQELLNRVIEQNPQLTSVFYCINDKANDFVLDLDMHLVHGKPYIEETLRDVTFRIGPKSFFQTNPEQAVRLFEVVEDFAGLTGNENVYDLYTGIGSIALFIAKNCKQVVGIEEVSSAIQDAKDNMERNDISNAIFYAGDVKDILTEDFATQHGKADILITDPPRAGMHPKVVEMLLKLQVPKIVYVSCNPATQARDLALLSEVYDVKKSQAVDMFPHTHHIENVALLTLK